MDPIALRQSKAAALQTAKQITDGAKALDRDLSAEEETKIDELLAQADDFEAKAKAIEAKAARMERLDGGIASLSQSAGRRAPASAPLTETPTSSTTVRENWKDDPKKGFRTHRDYLLAVMDAGQNRLVDRDVAARLNFLQAVGSDEGRGISDPAGGYLIPEGFSPNLMKIDPEMDPIGALTRKIPMANPLIRMPARVDKNHSTSVSGGLTVTRRPETVAGTASQITFEQVTMQAYSLFGLSYATEEILADSPISFVALLEAGFSDQFIYHLVNERLNGTGVGEFLGIMTALDSTSAGPTISVSKETGQAAATIVKENIDKMRAQCWGYDKAVWLVNHDCLPQLRSLVQVVGVGGAPVPYFSVDAAGNATLDGRPCMVTEYTKTIGTTGDIVLANWNEYLEGTYQPMQSAESIHVRFVNHERAFKFWTRNAGAPWWKSALTPKNSSAKLSPFVILATRS